MQHCDQDEYCSEPIKLERGGNACAALFPSVTSIENETVIS